MTSGAGAPPRGPEAPGAARPVAVLVLGMHRGGTSAMARFLSLLGATPPREPNPPADDNPDGYWEPAAVVQANNALLQAADGSWLAPWPLDLAGQDTAGFVAQAGAALARNFGDARCYVLKDPRICRMVPLYRDLLRAVGAVPRVVLVLRNPQDVVLSLAARNQLSAGYAGLLWAQHMLEAERDTRDLPRVVVGYDAALRDWQGAARRLHRLIADLAPPMDAAALGTALRPELRHHAGTRAAGFDPDIAAPLADLFAALQQLEVADDAAAHRQLDALGTELGRLAAAMRPALAAEFRFQRLTSPYDAARPADPLAERRAFATALAEMQAAARLSAPALVAQRGAAGGAKVGLFLAGMQKAGTTSLSSDLAAHPQLAAPQHKEPHFFDDEGQDWQAPDYAALDSWYHGSRPGALRFDATPIYSFWPPALERIQRYNPAARLLLLLRDPVERAFSHWAMEYQRGAETLPFAAAIREGRRRLPAGAPLAPAWRVFSYVERGFYAPQLRRALALFPARQVLCLDAARLRQDHAGCLHRIATFLGLEPFPAMAPKQENLGAGLAGPTEADIALLRQAFLPDLREVPALAGLELEQWPSWAAMPGPAAAP